MTTGRRLRVVYLDHVARLSGGELALLRTLPAMLKDVEPVVLLAEDGPLRHRLEARGVDVRVLPLHPHVRDARKASLATVFSAPRQVVELARYVWLLRCWLKELHPDVVHTNSLKAAIYGGLAGRLARIPVLWHVRDRIATDYLPLPAVLLVRLASLALPSALIANSKATLSTLPRRRSSSVLGSPVVPDAVARADDLPAPTPGRPLTVGVVGRLSPWKGQDVFLRAFALAFPDTSSRAVLVGSAMFGEEHWEHQLHQLVEEVGLGGRVVFRGFQHDVWAEYRALDIAVHCSTTPEPFGQVVIEAMAAGVPVIASREGGPAEVVTDGVDGLLVSPRDPVALAAAMRRLSSDLELRRTLVEGGRRTASRYSPERTGAAIVKIYRLMVDDMGDE